MARGILCGLEGLVPVHFDDILYSIDLDFASMIVAHQPECVIIRRSVVDGDNGELSTVAGSMTHMVIPQAVILALRNIGKGRHVLLIPIGKFKYMGVYLG